MKNVLVTGSQGFIGSYLCKDLLDNGYHVTGIDNYSKYGKLVRPHDSHPNFELVNMDAIDLHKNAQFASKSFDVLVAGAAMIGGISYFHKYAYDLLAANERITASTFDFAIKAFKEKRLKRIVVISSSMVFESTSVFPTPEEEVERCPSPESTYGFQKLATEYFCKGASIQYGLPFSIVRPFNCIGVGENEALSEEDVHHGGVKLLMSHVVPDLIYKCFSVGEEGPLPILGSGSQIRHYTCGDDIARGIRIVIESDQAVNNNFNISSDEPYSVTDVAKKIWKKIHGDAILRFEHYPPYDHDVQVRSPDTHKAKNVLGFECEKTLDDALDDIINWIKKQYGF